MNCKIIDINDERQKMLSFKKQLKQFTIDDIFDLFLMYESNDGLLSSFDLNLFEKAFARYKNMNRFSSILSNLETEYNKDGEEIVNFNSVIEQKIIEKVILLINNEVVIIGDEEYFNCIKRKYDKELFSIFDSLFFFVNNDLEFGFDNWNLLYEDEYIEDTIYPSIVTGEFIGQQKDEKTKVQIRKKIAERVKNSF